MGHGKDVTTCSADGRRNAPRQFFSSSGARQPQQRTRSSGTYRMAMGDAAAAGAMIASEMDASLAIWDICRRACRLRPFLAAAHTNHPFRVLRAPPAQTRGKPRPRGGCAPEAALILAGSYEMHRGTTARSSTVAQGPSADSLQGSPAFNCSWKYDDLLRQGLNHFE
jgi:hypothetical protein